MESVIDTIKAKIDVAEEIGQVVVLQKSGRSYKGLCPFHNERTPSFHVFAETQTWHCFGCNEGGDVFTFVQKQQNLEFRDALLYLAEKAGVSIEDSSSRNSEEEREANTVRERLRKLNEDALLWFHQVLLRSKEAVEARAYVQSRGISADSVMAFSLGYAPDQWDSLSRYLLAQGYTARELVSAGLAREREEERAGGVYDYFRNRLIFPIRDMRGRVIGFGGRALGDGQPKYLNSPQTVLFEKNSVLYALDMAKDAIKLAKQVVIVEGYVDAVIAHQYGTKQTVACIGSAITEKHIQQLKKLTKQVTLALDPDAAGMTATEHGIQEALKTFDRTIVPVPLPGGVGGVERMLSGTKRSHHSDAGGGYKRNEPRGMIQLEEQVDAEINVLQLPPGEDPDEVIRRNFPSWSYAVSHPLPLVDYYFIAKTAGLDLRQPTGKTEAAKRLLPIIGMIRDRIKRDAYVQKLATMISIDERSLYHELQQVLRRGGDPGSRPKVAEFSVPLEQRNQKGTNTASIRRETEGEELPETVKSRSKVELDRNRTHKLQWEDYLIGLLLHNPELSQHVCGIIKDSDFAGTDTRELYHILNSVYQRGSSSSLQPLEHVVPSALLTTIARARECVESRSQLDGLGQVKAAIQCATRLKRTRLVQRNTELQFLMREAKEVGDLAAVQQFQQQLVAIYQQLRTIDVATHLQG